VVDEIEFENMALQVVKIAGIFTGAESGETSTSKNMLTNVQLEALIEHQWPENNNSDTTGTLTTVIENIKTQVKKSVKKKHVEDSKKKKVNNASLINSKDARLKIVLDIARRLRREGVPSFIQF
jgi:hypothetical protein